MNKSYKIRLFGNCYSRSKLIILIYKVKSLFVLVYNKSKIKTKEKQSFLKNLLNLMINSGD